MQGPGGGVAAPVKVEINILKTGTGDAQAAAGLDKVKGSVDGTKTSTNMLTDAERQRLRQLQATTSSMKAQNSQALANLGMNLGMLFTVMSLSAAYTQLTSVLIEYGAVSEETGKKMQKIGKLVMMISTFFISWHNVVYDVFSSD